MRARSCVVGTVLVLLAAAAQATVVRFVSLDESIRLTDLLLLGTVVDTRARVEPGGQVVTDVWLRVEECWVGQVAPGTEFVFQAFGGRTEERWVRVEGEAAYWSGARVLVQLERVGEGFQTLGLSFGKWDVLEQGSRTILRRDLSGLTPASRTGGASGPFAPVSAVETELDLSDFRSRVERLSERGW